MSREVMQSILGKVAELKAANKAGKETLVPEYMKDPDFHKFMYFTLNDSLTFNVTRIKETEPVAGDFYKKLEELNIKGSANKADKEELAGLGSQSPEHLEVLNKILRKNPDCGITAKFMNGVMPGVVPYFPYQRCSTHEVLEKIFSKYVNSGAGPKGDHKWAFSELKENGLFIRVTINAMRVDGNMHVEPVFLTRNGKELFFPASVKNLFKRQLYQTGLMDRVGQENKCKQYPGWSHGVVFEGEGLVLDPEGSGMYLPRQAGNAIINKFQKEGYENGEEADGIHFSFWNTIPLPDYEKGLSEIPYRDRRIILHSILPKTKRIHPTEYKLVTSIEEAWDFYHEVRSRPTLDPDVPMEGTITKHPDEIWKDGKSSLMAKGKAEKQCCLRIVDTHPGKPGSKYEGMIGSFICESSCGMLRAKCSGMSDEDRAKPPEYWIGRLITGTFNEVSRAKDKETRSLDHFRYDDDRPDKTEADDLAHILSIKSKKRK